MNFNGMNVNSPNTIPYQQQQQQQQQHFQQQNRFNQPMPMPNTPPNLQQLTPQQQQQQQQQQQLNQQRIANALNSRNISQHQIPPHQMQQRNPSIIDNKQQIPPSAQLGQQQQQQQHPQTPSNQFLLAAQTITKVQENTHYWSEKYQEESKPQDKDVLFYEQLINRDISNRELLGHEREGQNKYLLARLVRDLKYYNELKISRMKTIGLSNARQYTNTIWGEGYQGYGNGFSDGQTRVILPKDRKKPSRLRDFNISKKLNEVQAFTPDDFIPIRLEFENEKDKFRLRDTFLWNHNEKTITLENLVAIIMEDYKLNNPLLSDTILASIKEQVHEYHSHVYNNKFGYDLRILVKLDIIIANNQLIDQFEWDISNPENSPEEFAETMTSELSLPGEFTTAIAHSIREQAQLYTRALYLIGYDFQGGYIDEEEIKANLRSIVTHQDYLRARNQVTQFTPQILDVSNPELERLDKDRERDSRRKRRQGRTGRRGGPVLPDLKDVPRTFRTPVPSTTLPGGIDFTDSVNSYDIITETINKPVEQPTIQQSSVHSTPIIVHETAGTPGRKRKVVVNHAPGVSCIVSIKLK